MIHLHLYIDGMSAQMPLGNASLTGGTIAVGYRRTSKTGSGMA